MSRREASARGHLRYSLRLRVFLAVSLAGLLLPIVVFAFSQLERTVPGTLWRETLDATDEVALDIEAHREPTEARTRALAGKYKARVRVVPRLERSGARETLDVDLDNPRDALHPVEAFFFLTRRAERASDLDSATPILARPETSYALAHRLYIDCEKDELRICHGVRPAKDREDREWIVYVDKSSARAVEEVYFVRRTLLRLSLVTAPLAMAIGFWAARRVTLPIENLRDEALKKALSESPGSNLTEHADEVGDLAEALNTLLSALERRRAENEAFVGDVVHEMKSPVAAITAVAEALEGPMDRPRQERLSRALGASAKKLDALVSQFLDLAKVEAGMAREVRDTVDLGKLASDVLARAESDPRHAEVRFVCESEGKTEISGVERRLEALIAELVDNAASFTPAGGAVRVRVTSKAGVVELVVEDEGPGIPEADASKVFDRFFTTRGEKRGTGLGLALVRAVALAHGGSARASTRERGQGASKGERTGGAVFTVTFPSVDPS